MSTELSKRIAQLPPEKRKLFEQLVRSEGLSLTAVDAPSRHRDDAREAIAEPGTPGTLVTDAASSPLRRPENAGKRNGTERPESLPLELQRRDSSMVVPLSYAQYRLWFLDQLVPRNPFYNKSADIRLAFALDVQILERSLSEVLRRHEALRTTFREVDGEPIQVIAPVLAFSVLLRDLSELAPEERNAEAMRRAREEAVQPFDLAAGPLVRASVLKLAPREYVLLLTMHHIVCDGWSLGVLLQELSAIYGAFVSGRRSPLADLPVQYGDYAMWQRAWLQDGMLDRLLGYWKQQLADLSTLQLPLDRPRPPVQTFRGAVYEMTFPDRLVERVQELSRQESATLFMTLLSTFDVLLYRYTGQHDITVGTFVANRSRVELEGLIGLFVNTLILRADLSGDPAFRTLLRRVSAVVLGAMAHQELPFEKLVEELQPERDLSRNPLFQVVFQLEMVDRASTHPGGGAWSTATGTAAFDLAYNLAASGDHLYGRIEYSTELFDEGTIERMARHYVLLLEGATADPDCCISQLPLLTDAERNALVLEWNRSDLAPARHCCVHELFEAQVERAPDAVAISCEGSSLSYSELNRRADHVASFLRQLGVGPEVCVGLYTARSFEMVIGLLAILKAGGVYVPLDPAYPQERLIYMLTDSGAHVVLTDERTGRHLPWHETQVVVLEQILAAAPEQQPAPRVFADNLAYVIYTSGSTGRPKGVQVRHGAVVNFLSSMSQRPGLSAEDTLLALTTFSFDISVLELLLPLSVGARVAMAAREWASDGERLVEAIAASNATVVQATPATWRLLLEAGWAGDGRVKMLCGGEALPRDLANALIERGVSLWNLYGPTETTVWSAVLRVEPGNNPVTIGSPIRATQIYVLDAMLQPVPIGVPGELYIGGAGLARGYRNRPALTAERFVPHPFAVTPGARLYRTGDLVRRRPDGTIEFMGRMDDQVKIRGFRIELGEVEAALRDLSGVTEALVVAHEDAPGDARLIAYLVPHDMPGPSAGTLRQLLRVRLPLYMMPSAFVALEALPRMPNGKVDRHRLVSRPHTPSLENDYVGPRTPIETQLAQLWADVLHLDRIGVEDNFFELGGHSLVATQLISRVRRLFRSDLPLRAIFEEPTVAGLATRIEHSRKAGEAGVEPAIPRLSRERHRATLPGHAAAAANP